MVKLVNPKLLIEVELIMTKIEYRKKQAMLNGKKEHLVEIVEKIAGGQELDQDQFNEFIKSLEYGFKKQLKEVYSSIINDNLKIDELSEKTKKDRVIKLIINYINKYSLSM